MKAKRYEHGLCHRCENRVRFYETGHGPRCECGMGPKFSTSSCYAYRPVTPLIMRRSPGDLRNFGFRSTAVGLAKGQLETCNPQRSNQGPCLWIRYFMPSDAVVKKEQP